MADGYIFVSYFEVQTSKLRKLFRYNLGKVLEAMGDYDLAARSYSTALEVQKSSPITPFSAVPLCFE